MQGAEVLADAAVLRPEQVAAGRWQQCHANLQHCGGRAVVLLSCVWAQCVMLVLLLLLLQRRARAAASLPAALNSGTVTLECSNVYSVSVGVFMFMPCAARWLRQALSPCSICSHGAGVATNWAL